MARTTIDIDAEVMRELKRRQAREGKPLGRLVSELLAAALERPEAATSAGFFWTARSMGAVVDIGDKESLRRSTAKTAASAE
jgi:hypothetical protein